MKFLIVVSHHATWFLTHTCISTILNNTDDEHEVKIIVVDNAPHWSKSIKAVEGIDDRITVLNNSNVIKVHASCIDFACRIFADWDYDYLIPVDSDVVIRSPDWLNILLGWIGYGHLAGGWHPVNRGIYCSFAIYKKEVWTEMDKWQRETLGMSTEARWGENFNNVGELDIRVVHSMGPFHERRGFPQGTHFDSPPHGQMVNVAVYEPGEGLYYWTVYKGYSGVVIPTYTVKRGEIPNGTHYGNSNQDFCAADFASHMWAGTRALFKLIYNAEARVTKEIPENERGVHIHEPMLNENMGFWLRREAYNWLVNVPKNERERLLDTFSSLGGWQEAFSYGDRCEDEISAASELATHYRESGIPI